MGKQCKECGQKFDPSTWKLYFLERYARIPFWFVWKYGDYCSNCKAGIYYEKYFLKELLVVAIVAIILIIIAVSWLAIKNAGY